MENLFQLAFKKTEVNEMEKFDLSEKKKAKGREMERKKEEMTEEKG